MSKVCCSNVCCPDTFADYLTETYVLYAFVYSVRQCGAERSLKLLAMEDSASRKLPQVSDVDLRGLHDIFIVKSQRTLTTDNLPSVCQASTFLCMHISIWLTMICMCFCKPFESLGCQQFDILMGQKHFKHVWIFTAIFCLRAIHSSSYRTLAGPRTCTTLGDRSFAVTGPHAWNSLPATIKQITSYGHGQFRQHLKTHLFRA